MRIAVIGAGVVGVTTAYALARAGHAVTVIERQAGTAMESSFANGGQLSFGFAAPMASTGLLRKAPGILMGRDRAFRLPVGFVLRQPGWAMRFAHACLPAQGRRYGRELLAMARQSRDALDRLCEDTGASFERRRAGKLILFASPAALASSANSFRERGLNVDQLDPDGCVQLDPAIASVEGRLAGGIWIDDDEVGDAEMFCRRVVDKSRDQFGVRFVFDDDVQNISPQPGGRVDVRTAGGAQLDSDAVVLCMGASGTRLLTQLGIDLPLVPVAGYSLTAQPGPDAPTVAITDADNKFVCSRIGQFVRIAGFADFGRLTDAVRRRRIDDLIRVARQRFPAAANYSEPFSTWSGLRPATPTSLPIVGASGVPGVFLNMGHGMYGWTLSAVTAERVAQQIDPSQRQSHAA